MSPPPFHHVLLFAGSLLLTLAGALAAFFLTTDPAAPAQLFSFDPAVLCLSFTDTVGASLQCLFTFGP